MPIVFSGVAIQSRYIIEGLLKTGRYEIVSLGAAPHHKNYQPIRVDGYGENWTILPTVGYGNEDLIRNTLKQDPPDAIWFMTDPRFYKYLFNMAGEIRNRNIPLLYYHVWDNTPTPYFNKSYYDACDFIGCISKLTHNVVKTLVGEEKCQYIPHAVDENLFKQFSLEEIDRIKAEKMPQHKDKFILFYNSRNAHRKMTADIIRNYKLFLDFIGKNKAFFLLNTNPKDPEGGDLEALCNMLGLTPNEIQFTNGPAPTEELVKMYNIADSVIALSSNEGFGLSSLESLYCGTPVISTRTGGLQEQNIMEDGTQLGVSIKPATSTIKGGHDIPYITEDRCVDKDVMEALLKMYNLSRQSRFELGEKAREHALKNFSMDCMINSWDQAITKYVGKYKKGGDI